MSALAPEVVVNVKHVVVTIDGSGNPVVTPDTVNVTSNYVLVYATIDPSAPGYTFPDTDAIVVNTQNSDFPYPSWTVKPTLAAVVDLGHNAGSYNYTVFVNGPTGQKLRVDPVIKNGNTGGGGG
jgi:hypothetical protein